MAFITQFKSRTILIVFQQQFRLLQCRLPQFIEKLTKSQLILDQFRSKVTILPEANFQILQDKFTNRILKFPPKILQKLTEYVSQDLVKYYVILQNIVQKKTEILFGLVFFQLRESAQKNSREKSTKFSQMFTPGLVYEILIL